MNIQKYLINALNTYIEWSPLKIAIIIVVDRIGYVDVGYFEGDWCVSSQQQLNYN